MTFDELTARFTQDAEAVKKKFSPCAGKMRKAKGSPHYGDFQFLQ